MYYTLMNVLHGVAEAGLQAARRTSPSPATETCCTSSLTPPSRSRLVAQPSMLRWVCHSPLSWSRHGAQPSGLRWVSHCAICHFQMTINHTVISCKLPVIILPWNTDPVLTRGTAQRRGTVGVWIATIGFVGQNTNGVEFPKVVYWLQPFLTHLGGFLKRLVNRKTGSEPSLYQIDFLNRS